MAQVEASDSDDGMPGMLSDYLVYSDDDVPDDDVEPTQGGARRAARRMPSSVYEAVRHAAEQRCTEETGSRPRASGAPPVVDPVASLGMTVSEDLRRLRRRLIEYLGGGRRGTFSHDAARAGWRVTLCSLNITALSLDGSGDGDDGEEAERGGGGRRRRA